METITPKKIDIRAFMKEPTTIEFNGQNIEIPIYGVDQIDLFAPIFEEGLSGEDRIKKIAKLGEKLLTDIVGLTPEEMKQVPFTTVLNFASKVIEANGFTSGDDIKKSPKKVEG